MNYRPEITGLRAISVLAIILFHTEIATFRNGFIGVDIFFVISGYLITGLIINKSRDNTFSIGMFYLSRLKRLLPVLLVVLFICIPFAFIWLFDYQLRNFFQSLIAASLFSSNFLFLFEFQHYFSDQSTLRPLLHTWSLGVEWQFYITYPLLLLTLIKFGKRFTVAGIIFLTLLSALYVEFYLPGKVLQQYYLPQSRVWIFGLGALAYFAYQRLHRFKWRYSKSYALIGMLLMILPMFILIEEDNRAHYNSLFKWTNVPILGVWLVIVFVNHRDVVFRLLTSKLLVAIGMISYSLYLWHYPIFVFARIRISNITGFDYVGLILVALLLSTLSWKYIERYFKETDFISNKLYITVSAFLVCALFLVGGYGVKSYGTGDASYKSVNELDQLRILLGLNKGMAADCSSVGENSLCRTDEEPEILLWGDSFAMHMVDGFLSSNPEVKMEQATLSACSPFFNEFLVSKSNANVKRNKCLEFNSRVISYAENISSLKYIVISSRFSNYFYEPHLYLKQRKQRAVRDYDKVLKSIEALLSRLEKRGLKVIIIDEPWSPPPEKVLCAARSLKFRLDDEQYILGAGISQGTAQRY